MQRFGILTLAIATVFSVLIGYGATALVRSHNSTPAQQTQTSSVTVSSVVAPPDFSIPTPQVPVEEVPAERVIATDQGDAAAPAPAEIVEHRAAAERFVMSFDLAHQSGDVGYLLATLHPKVSAGFGVEQCSEYVRQTLGSIRDMRVLLIAEPTTYELQGPTGPLTFNDALPVYGEWEITATGERHSFEFHLAPTDSGYAWLTTCGQPKATEA